MQDKIDIRTYYCIYFNKDGVVDAAAHVTRRSCADENKSVLKNKSHLDWTAG